ncbi:hypothetical protein J2X63_002209 [Agromyces sp. 3263]|uniref:hypothetical protein n=1 Tax=Agromyces sp. 3263 TaxID=2817750 RepID=UPI0028585D40|nr:hypothetical protein [Agromyces sp. 3263]MDR6906523.1 hypothetical protein [Agromyces sp. 3263]
MNTLGDITSEQSGAGAGAARVRLRSLGVRTPAARTAALAAAGLMVVALGVVHQAQAAHAAELVRARSAAVAAVGDRVGIGASGLDVAAAQLRSATSLATDATVEVQATLDAASAELGADRVAGLSSLRDGLLAAARLGGSAPSLAERAAALRAEAAVVATALAEHRAAEAARIAAEAAAAAEAARVAASAAAAAAAEAESAFESEGIGGTGGTGGGSSAAAPAAAESSGFDASLYPGLPPAPRDEDCGPCTGKEMVPILVGDTYRWGCHA